MLLYCVRCCCCWCCRLLSFVCVAAAVYGYMFDVWLLVVLRVLVRMCVAVCVWCCRVLLLLFVCVDVDCVCCWL